LVRVISESSSQSMQALGRADQEATADADLCERVLTSL
jgi:hypothetical protein